MTARVQKENAKFLKGGLKVESQWTEVGEKEQQGDEGKDLDMRVKPDMGHC